MKINKKSFSRTVSALLVICALSFSTNMNASNRGGNSFGGGSWFGGSWFGGNHNGGNHHRGNPKNGGNHNGGQPGCNEPSQSVPLDGGLSILLIGAAAFGVKKLRGNKNEEI